MDTKETRRQDNVIEITDSALLLPPML